jgi:hypothetical protein
MFNADERVKVLKESQGRRHHLEEKKKVTLAEAQNLQVRDLHPPIGLHLAEV